MAKAGGARERFQANPYPADILDLYHRHQDEHVRRGNWILIAIGALGLWGGFLAALTFLGTESPLVWSSIVVVASFLAAFRPEVAVILFLLVSSSAPEAEGAILRPQDVGIPIILIFSWTRAAIIGIDARRIKIASVLVMFPLIIMGIDMVFHSGKGVYPFGIRLLSSSLLFTVPLVSRMTHEELLRTLRWGLLIVLAGHAYWIFQTDTSSVLHGPSGEQRPVFSATAVFSGLCATVLWVQSRAKLRFLMAFVVLMATTYIVILAQGRVTFIALVGGLVALMVFSAQRNKFFAIAIVGLAILVTAQLLGVVNLPTTILKISSEESSYQARRAAYQIFIYKALDSPLKGTGTASNSLGMYDSEYLRTFAESGVVGLGYLIYMLFFLFRFGWSSNSDSQRGPAQVALLVVLSAVCIDMLGLTTLMAIRTSEMFFGLCGLLVATILASERTSARPIALTGSGSRKARTPRLT